MSNPRYPEEFKIEGVKHSTKRSLPVAEIAHSLYSWVKGHSKPKEQLAQKDHQRGDLRRLCAESSA